jgi:hypothetical protein
MDPAEWTRFSDWMHENELVSSTAAPEEVLSNAYLPGSKISE